ncbi:MAG: conjugal transfer protein TraF [Myxococcales bacterium]
MKNSRTFQSIIALASSLGCLLAGSASAGEWTLVGARYQGMGGAGVATVNDSLAPYWNPAALAMAQSYDGVLNFDIMASIEGDVLEVIDNLEDSQGEVEAALDRLESGGVLSADDEATLDELLVELERLGDDGTGVLGTGTAGLNMRWKNYAVFSRAHTEFAIDPTYDDQNQEFVVDTEPDSLLNNESGARVRGLGVIESGVGYGHSFFDGLLSVGANLKYMHGITYTKYVGYRTIDEAELDFGDSNLREESGNFGLDLGLMSKPFDFLQVGLVARNVNSPKFTTGRDPLDPNGRKNFTMDAQVRMGAAFFPFSNDMLVIATDLDLTENESDLLSGYKSRLWSLGAEYKIPIKVVSIALRAGGYMNAASGADHAFVLTGGLGLKVWLLTLDLAGGASPAQADIKANGDKYPTRLNFSAVLGIRGNF